MDSREPCSNKPSQEDTGKPISDSKKKKIDAVPILMPEAFSVMMVIAHTFCWQLRELVQSLHSFHFGLFISVLVANRPVGIPGQS